MHHTVNDRMNQDFDRRSCSHVVVQVKKVYLTPLIKYQKLIISEIKN